MEGEDEIEDFNEISHEIFDIFAKFEKNKPDLSKFKYTYNKNELSATTNSNNGSL